jgi:hypothetical protein
MTPTTLQCALGLDVSLALIISVFGSVRPIRLLHAIFGPLVVATP